MNSPIIFLQNLFADISLRTTPRLYYTAGTYEDLTADTQDSKLSDPITKAWGFPRVVWELPFDEKMPQKSKYKRSETPIALLFAVKYDEIPNYANLNAVERLAYIRDCAMQFFDLLVKAAYEFNTVPNKQFRIIGDMRLITQRAMLGLKNKQLYYWSSIEVVIDVPTDCYSALYDVNSNISPQLQPQNPPVLSLKDLPQDKDLVNLNT